MSKIYDVWAHPSPSSFGSHPATDSKPRSLRCLGGVCERLRTVLTSLCFETTVVTLTLLSVLAITGEILIDYGILTAPPDNEAHQTSTDSGKSQPQEVLDSSADRKREALETVQAVFHYLSLAIAAAFLLEMLVKIAVFRRKFFVQPWQVVDLVVVCASVAVEIAFEVNGRLSELEVCTFIIIFRLWRLPHACNIKAERVQRDLDQEIEVWKAGASKMQDRCNTLDAKNAKQKEKIERLERELAALKKDLKENSRSAWRQENSDFVPNGSVPGAHRNVKSSNHLAESLPTGARGQHTTAESEDEDTIDGSPGRRGNRRREEEERDTEEDTVEEDEGEEEHRRSYFPSGSESSLSCHAMEQEVRVQIEDEEGTAAASNSPVQMRRAMISSKDKKADTAETPARREVCYENGGFIPDLEEGDDFHGELLQEFDGARTYRSADGIPMTDL